MKFFLLIILILCCSACSLQEKENVGNSVTISNQIDTLPSANYPLYLDSLNFRGKWERQIFEKPPERVISVWQNSIETLLALGVGDRIVAGVGVPDAQYILPEYRAAYERIPHKGLRLVDLETAMMMEPDLIIAWASTFGAKVLTGSDFWHSRGVRTYVASSSMLTPSGHTLYNEYGYIWDLGRIFDRRGRALDLIREMRAEIDWARTQADSLDRQPAALVIEIMGKEMRVYGNKSLAADIVRNLNGRLLAGDMVSISLEQLIELNPEALFLVLSESQFGNEQMTLNRIYDQKSLRDLKCVKEKRIYIVPLYAVHTAGIRAYDGIQIFARGLYPELYKESI